MATTLADPRPVSADQERTRVSPAKFAHVVLLSIDKERLLQWYREVLDGEIVYDSSFVGFVTYDDEHHRVAVASPPGVTRAERSVGGRFVDGLHHVAFTYSSLSDLVYTYERLARSGIVPEMCTNHGPTISFYYLDPDQNRVELQIDVFDTSAEARAFFESQEFADNPFGVEFDAAEFATRFRNGEDEQSLLVRPNIGVRQLP